MNTRRAINRRLVAMTFVATMGSALATMSAAAELRLVELAERNDTAAVRNLLTQKVEVDAPDAAGNTALAWAVHHENTVLIDLLLTAGASPRIANRYGVLPLSIACVNGSALTVSKLLAAGADPNAQQGDGETALMTAARSGNLDTVTRLIERGADVNAAERWRGQTPLMWAAAEGHTAVVRLLLARGANPAARSQAGAASSRRTRSAGAAPEGPRGFTALLFAVRGGHIGAVKTLLDGGAGVDEKTPQGNTLLHLAIMNAHYELAGELLARGANPNAINPERLTPLHHVIHTRRPGWQTLPPPVPTGKLDSLDLMRQLIAKGADVNARLGPVEGRPAEDDEQIPPPAHGATPLWLAATGPDVDAVRVLLAAGADPFISSEVHTSTLVAAAGIEYRQGYRQKMEAEVLEAVTLLLARGLDVNAADDSGNTPLHGAAMRGVNAVVALLVEKGADLDAWNLDGKRPVELAEDASDARAQPETAALLRRLMAAAKTTAAR